MKCAITGHTRGLGKSLYNHFKEKGWEVIGFSTTNGYFLPDALEKVIEESNGCDLFINNTFAQGHQIDLLHALKYKVKNMVVCGSIARTEPLNEILYGDYVDIKTELAKSCNILSISNDSRLMNILHLDLGFLEGSVENILDPTEFISDYTIGFNDVISAIELWLLHPKIKQIEFSWKLTPFLETRLKRATNNPDSLNKLLSDINEA
jgi:hypothetical protein